MRMFNPGGLTARADFGRELDDCCDGLDDRQASAQLGLSDGGLGYWVAAIRECFEESGYLLARTADGELVQPDTPALAAHRQALAANERTMQQVCSDEGLTLMCDALQYVAFWTTPEIMPRRYATRFFVATVPAGQTGAHDGRETVASEWVLARSVVDDAERVRTMQLHPPTLETLRWLAGHASAEATMVAAAAVDKSAIEEILPVVINDGAGRRVRLASGRVVEF